MAEFCHRLLERGGKEFVAALLEAAEEHDHASLGEALASA